MNWAPCLCFQDSKVLLLELSTHANKRDFEDYEREIYELQGMGIDVIIAHPERYKAIQEDISIAERLVSCGCVLQASADFVRGGRMGKERKPAQRLLEAGLYTYIGSDVVIGGDTVILPGCVIEGNTTIGEGCEIGPFSRLTDMKLGDGVKFQSSTALESEIGNDATVGPYAYIRPNCKIGNRVKVGDFVEVKNSNIGDGTKIPHLSYVGDTDAGERINFGCGSIMVNYDGKKKHRTVIEDGVFVGCNVNLVAPVRVEKGAYIAAGSTITKDVPAEVLAVARAKQTIIEGWVKKRND